jgi:hypothetical protein
MWNSIAGKRQRSWGISRNTSVELQSRGNRCSDSIAHDQAEAWAHALYLRRVSAVNYADGLVRFVMANGRVANGPLKQSVGLCGAVRLLDGVFFRSSFAFSCSSLRLNLHAPFASHCLVKRAVPIAESSPLKSKTVLKCDASLGQPP